jgi:multidrug efflux pump subunit AcrA (membrane-fusion protein)
MIPGKKFVAAIAGLTVLVILIGYWVYQFRGTAQEAVIAPPEKESAYLVEVAKAVRGDLEELLFIAGTIVPGTRVEVFSRGTGQLQEVRVKEGDRVEKDTILAVVRENKAEPIFIRSPIAGTVEQRFYEPGNIVIAVEGISAKPLFTIVDTEVVKVQIGLHEAMLSVFQVGQEARVRVSAYPTAVFKGKITSISPILDEGSRTAKTDVSIGNRDHRLKPGMLAMVGLVTEKLENILLVPKESIISGDESALVYVVRNNTAHELEVQVGASEGGLVQIRNPGEIPTGPAGATARENPWAIRLGESGVREGEEVVTAGARMVHDGQAVEVIR